MKKSRKQEFLKKANILKQMLSEFRFGGGRKLPLGWHPAAVGRRRGTGEDRGVATRRRSRRSRSNGR
ncbi:hypothetical protein L596_017539 [Steinernema carpocapsae]|uniref:Uncharacterized protein n=1 Tax=Steinernema carpocapsae TaxID=34508 RepID=A0A4U5N1Z3_STECR|nr:hypothetical protein L596_017539 [Steinernema carpocapsae]